MMSPHKKIRSLIITAAFLLIINIVLLFLIFNNNESRNTNAPESRSIIESFLQDQIGFDKQQMDIYKNMRKDDFEKRGPIFDTLKSVKNKFYESIYNDSTPDSIINKLAIIVSEKQMIVDKHMLQYFKKVRRICTASQLPKFDSSFKSVVDKITSIRLRSKKP